VKRFLNIAVFSFLLVYIGLEPAFPESVEDTIYEQRIEYRNGRISLAFKQIPVDVALEAIRARTGFRIVLPVVVEPKFINLKLDPLPLEPAIRFLISAIGFKNFALVYDERGLPSRAIVLEAGPSEPSSVASNSNPGLPNPDGAAQPLTTEERDNLQKELERWSELKTEERMRLEGRLKVMPPSESREQLVKTYGLQLLGIKK